MKIYFAGSIRGGREDKELYLQIIHLLTEYGEVLTEHVGDPNLEMFGETTLTDEFIFKRDREWLASSDVVIAEVTTPSLGVGYELALTEIQKKNILCLYRESEGKRCSAMIVGNPYFKVRTYSSLDQVKEILKNYFSTL
jgi:hypothetical protein